MQKQLSLQEIHKLYLILKPYLPEKEEDYLIYEVIRIMEKITPQEFQESMLIMYGKKFNFKQNPGKLAVEFINGVKKHNLFSYIHFVKSIK